MASATYYQSFNPNPNGPTPLKPFVLQPQHHYESPMASPMPSPSLKPAKMQHYHESPHPSPEFHDPTMHKMHGDDMSLKLRIRRLRIFQRILSTLFSTAVFVPITMTLYKFSTTKNIEKTVTQNGKTVTRNAWAMETTTWPTFMYFGTATASLLLNVVTLLFYLRGITHANRANAVATAFNWAIIGGNVIVWAVAAGFYRYGKDLHGKPNDLWGWTCSSAAQEIQEIFKDQVQFEKYCGVQSASWYAGLAHVGSASLSGFVYFLVWQRYRSKKNIRRMSARLLSEYS